MTEMKKDFIPIITNFNEFQKVLLENHIVTEGVITKTRNNILSD